MVAHDHHTLDAWGRTPNFCPFLLALLAFGMRIPTFTPIPILPALGIDLVAAALARRRESWLAALLAGVAFTLLLSVQESAWMAWVVGRPWDLGHVAA